MLQILLNCTMLASNTVHISLGLSNATQELHLAQFFVSSPSSEHTNASNPPSTSRARTGNRWPNFSPSKSLSVSMYCKPPSSPLYYQRAPSHRPLPLVFQIWSLGSRGQWSASNALFSPFYFSGRTHLSPYKTLDCEAEQRTSTQFLTFFAALVDVLDGRDLLRAVWDMLAAFR